MPEPHPPHHQPAQRLHDLTPTLLGVLLGSALQLQQAELWHTHVYMLLVPLALFLYGLIALINRANWRSMSHWITGGAALLAVALLAFGLTGWRASVFASQALSPALEGRDIAVTGVVASLPQRFEGGVRFRFDLETAQLDGQPVALPPRLELAWYAGVFGQGDGTGDPAGELQRMPEPVQAGERWQVTVRLKAPHGGINPHGFDFELWQWEQGVQASGYVRAGRKDPAPQRLGLTWQHPVDGVRQQVRERIFAHVPDLHAAGLMAALVTGDQGAIERADWDVYRATGISHLVSISGLHITTCALLLVSWLGAFLLGFPALLRV